MRDYKINDHYTHHRGFDPIIVLIAVILILLVLEASWGRIYEYFGFDENCQHCNLLAHSSCQVMEEIENPRECAVLQEFIQDNEINSRSLKWRSQYK